MDVYTQYIQTDFMLTDTKPRIDTKVKTRNQVKYAVIRLNNNNKKNTLYASLFSPPIFALAHLIYFFDYHVIGEKSELFSWDFHSIGNGSSTRHTRRRGTQFTDLSPVI